MTVATGTGAKGLGSHSLRHSCARHWLQSGLNVNAVSAWLGHSNPTVTLDTYLVLAPDTLWASARLRNPYCANPVLRSSPAKTPSRPATA